MSNIIFLDIDGPIIPAPLYALDMGCSALRSIMSTTAIGFVQILCRDLNCKVVTNTAHNYHLSLGDKELREDLIKFKLDPKYIHDNWRTLYPSGLPTAGENFTKVGVHPRLRAIDLWIQKNGPIDKWICFDDELFMGPGTVRQHPNLVLISFDEGITLAKYEEAVRILSQP